MFLNSYVPFPGSIGVQKWGLGEVSGFRWGPACGWGTVGGISALSRKKQESLVLPHPHPELLHPPCEHTPRRHHLEARNRILTRNQVYSTFILDFSASRTVRIEYLLFKSPSLWVAKAQAEWTPGQSAQRPRLHIHGSSTCVLNPVATALSISKRELLHIHVALFLLLEIQNRKSQWFTRRHNQTTTETAPTKGACSVFASSRPRLQRARHVLGAWDRGVVLRVLTPSYTRESLVQQIQVFTEP